MTWIDGLKKGDRVGVNFGFTSFKIGVVAKKTATQVVLEDGDHYYLKDGYEVKARTGKWDNRRYLVDLDSDRGIAELKKILHKDVLRAIEDHPNDISQATLGKIQEMVQADIDRAANAKAVLKGVAV